MAFVNQFGSIDDDQQKAFEKSLDSDVEAYLNSLIDKGVSLADVRLAVHHLMASMYMVEAGVILREQIKARRAKHFPSQGEK
jgi:hypothetical protein